MDRRTLGEMLAEIADGAFAASATGIAMRATSMQLSLPVEIRVRRGDMEPADTNVGDTKPGDTPTLLGDVPLFRWRTDFDAPASRVTVHWHETPGAPSHEPAS
ncbi:MAG: hypothetical protein QOD93_7447 [Acetobacteraceae bacterium]|jgi:hypothetical protein|nr:hypothetical protein [Acetobacteraceae bacterium]MEA2774485.1 hypothetical protein [Acetobacteraceae bacterium]